MDLYHMSSSDILLINFGLHFPKNIQRYKHLIHRLADEYSVLIRNSSSNVPKVIWRETSAQNFKNENKKSDFSGYFVSKASTNTCGPIKDHNYAMAFKQDVRNRIADQIFGKAGIPIMRVNNASLPEWFQHVGYQNRTDMDGIEDCTHYCQPSGVFYHWREVFFNIINVLV